MDHVVAKEFKTVNRKFAVDDPISESDIHPEGLLTFEHWKSRSFIKETDAAVTVMAASTASSSENNPD